MCLPLLTFSSCGIIEMRDSYVETEKGEANTDLLLAPAERKNEVEIKVEEEPEIAVAKETAKTVVTFTAAGAIRIDDAIIEDAANRASDGNTYSFLKMYSGIYRDIRDADVALGSYPAASSPCGSEDKTHTTPIESLAALSELGFTVLDTSGEEGESERYPDDMLEYGIGNIHSSLTGDEAIYTVEQDGITIAFLAADDTLANGLSENIEYADFMSDIVVVSLNWSDGASVSDKQKTAAVIAEAGADIIIGSGDTLGGVEWIDTEDGTMTLVVYSLGNFVATSEKMDNLYGGILSLDITLSEGVISLENVCVDPIIIYYTSYYTSDNKNYQLFELSEYSEDISATHAVENFSVAYIKEAIYSLIPDAFLPTDIRR